MHEFQENKIVLLENYYLLFILLTYTTVHRYDDVDMMKLRQYVVLLNVVRSMVNLIGLNTIYQYNFQKNIESVATYILWKWFWIDSLIIYKYKNYIFNSLMSDSYFVIETIIHVQDVNDWNSIKFKSWILSINKIYKNIDLFSL